MQDIKPEVTAIRESQHRTEIAIVEIQKDLSAHMARTHANEERILYLERIFIGLASVAVLGGIIKVLIS